MNIYTTVPNVEQELPTLPKRLYLFLIITNILFWIRAVIVIVFSSVGKWPLELIFTSNGCLFYMRVCWYYCKLFCFLCDVCCVVRYFYFIISHAHILHLFILNNSEAGTAFHFGVPDFIPFFCGVHVTQYLVLYVVRCVL